MSWARVRFTLATLAVVPVLAGCVVFKAPPKGKQIDANTVALSFTICASGSTCTDPGNSGDDADDGRTNVLLLGFRVPIGSSLPTKIRPVRSDVAGTVHSSNQYAHVLNEEAPTPVGFEWVGYRSKPRTTNQGDAARFKVAIDLPPGFDEPSFNVRPVVGFFEPDVEHPADSPIVCGAALFDRVSDDDGERACIDSPTPDETAAHLSVPIA